MRMLAVDIGNTSVYVALFAEGRILKRLRFATSEVKTKAARAVAALAKSERAEAVVIGSVVPEAGKKLKTALLRAKTRALLIGTDLDVPVPNRYRDPRQVGTDRLLNAAAAWEEHERACIVVDFGTAITFDVVSSKGEYLGGVIAPGIEITLDSLFERTALLPKIKLADPSGVVGKDTVESIQSGCTYGLGGLCDRLVEEISRTQKTRPTVVFTGGNAAFMARYCRRVDHIDPDLTVRGILLTYASFKPSPGAV